MIKYWKKTGFGLLGIASLALAGCNGQEDFADAIIGGDPLGGGTDGANFQAGDACAPRVIGALVDRGTARNISYHCDGFYGRTGETGLPEEIEQNFFVCPLGARSVDFLIGGKEASLKLGTGYFREATTKNPNGCTYTDGEYASGSVYDADGPYLFSVADLLDSPARVDVLTDGAPDENRAQNISALLQGLDGVPGNELIDIADAAHTVIFQGIFSFPEGVLDQAFDTFVSNEGDARAYLDEVQEYIATTTGEEGAVGTLPAADGQEAEDNLALGGNTTAAGLYRFDLLIGDYFGTVVGYPINTELYYPDAVLADSLSFLLANYVTAPDATDEDGDGVIEGDGVLAGAISSGDYFPFMLVDRQRRVTSGGPFDVVNYDSKASRCPSGFSVYLALDSGAALKPSLIFDGVAFSPLSTATSGSMTLPGRFIDGLAYSGMKSSTDEDSLTDYELKYGDLPDSAHQFDAATDRTLIHSTFCGVTIENQLVNTALHRAGVVTPRLDTAVMDKFFSAPAAYTLSYLHRTTRDGQIDTEKAALPVTIHRDGSIYTDLTDGSGGGSDGNPDSSFTLPDVPPGEFMLGMVSSVFRGIDDPATPEDESIDDATMNLVLFNFGSVLDAGKIPMYGSHFRGRLVPDTTGQCDNRLFAASDEGVEGSVPAVWYDPQAIATWFSTSGAAATEETRYEAVRTLAYGHVQAKLTSCP